MISELVITVIAVCTIILLPALTLSFVVDIRRRLIDIRRHLLAIERRLDDDQSDPDGDDPEREDLVEETRPQIKLVA